MNRKFIDKKHKLKELKKTIQSLIKEMLFIKDLTKSKLNLRIVSYLQFEDYFNQLEDNTVERKVDPALNI